MTEQPRQSGPDLIGDLQRWLIRSGARGVSRELGGHVRSAFGLGAAGKADVWGDAIKPPPEEPAECGWCPFCRAARMLRESGPGLGGYVEAASETLASMAADALSVVESAMSAAGRNPGRASRWAGDGADDPGPDWDEPDAMWDEAGGDVWGLAAEAESAEPPVTGPGTTGLETGEPAERLPHEPDDRD